MNTVPQHMAMSQLGNVKAVFKPGSDNMVAGMIIGLLAIGLGTYPVYLSISAIIERGGDLPMNVKGNEWSWAKVAVFSIPGILVVIGGVFLIRWVDSLATLMVQVGNNGFAVTRTNEEARFFAWDAIVGVTETHVHERLPLAKGAAKHAMPTMVSKAFTIKREVGDEFLFSAATLKGFLKLAKMIKEETDKRQIPWEIVEEHS